LIGVEISAGRLRFGKSFQNSVFGGSSEDDKTGMSAHFFFPAFFFASGGKKIEMFGFNHFSVADQTFLMPSWIRPRPGTENKKHFQEICRTVLLQYMFF